MECWKDVVGFEAYFEVSDQGSVKSKRTGKILVQGETKSGYKVISTKIGGRKGSYHCLRVHRLVAEAFLPQPDAELAGRCAATVYGKVLVRHLDGNKQNNVVSNLAWGSASDNYEDFRQSPDYEAYLSKVSGINNVHSKLTEEQVEYIRKCYTPFCKVSGARALARRFGVHHSAISQAANEVSYKALVVQ